MEICKISHDHYFSGWITGLKTAQAMTIEERFMNMKHSNPDKYGNYKVTTKDNSKESCEDWWIHIFIPARLRTDSFADMFIELKQRDEDMKMLIKEFSELARNLES